MVEVQNADIVAFLRNGKILCESSPNNLVKNLNVKSLDEAFLKLSLEQHETM
jgi:ABC-type Na+ transport system ATPase subunit NatA